MNDDFEVNEKIYVMSEAPLGDWDAERIQECRDWLFTGEYTDQELADIFVLIKNHVGWLHHELNDPDGTITIDEFKNWDMLCQQAEYRIVHRFLPKYGYRNGNGWWIKESR